MLSDGVHLFGFIGFCRIFHQTVELVHQKAECVSEYRAELHQHINARATKLFKRHQLVMADFAKCVIGRLSAHQPYDNGNRFAFGLDGIKPQSTWAIVSG